MGSVCYGGLVGRGGGGPPCRGGLPVFGERAQSIARGTICGQERCNSSIFCWSNRSGWWRLCANSQWGGRATGPPGMSTSTTPPSSLECVGSDAPEETLSDPPHPMRKPEREGETMRRWKKMAGIGKRLCFWALLAAMVAGGSGKLPPLDALFLVFGILLFGVVCAFIAPSSAPGERPRVFPPRPRGNRKTGRRGAT